MLVIYEEYSVDLLIEGGGFPAFWYCLGYGKQYIKVNKPKFIAGYSAGSIVAVLLLFPDLNILNISVILIMFPVFLLITIKKPSKENVNK